MLWTVPYPQIPSPDPRRRISPSSCTEQFYEIEFPEWMVAQNKCELSLRHKETWCVLNPGEYLQSVLGPGKSRHVEYSVSR